MSNQNKLGVKPKVFIPITAKKFNSSVAAIIKDWQNRSKWFGLLCDIESMKNIPKAMLDDLENLRCGAKKRL